MHSRSLAVWLVGIALAASSTADTAGAERRGLTELVDVLIFADGFESTDFRKWSTSTNEFLDCNDFNGCTQVDRWVGGICTGTSPKSCPSADPCHEISFCVPATGICPNPPKADGTPCSVGNTCSMGADTCLSGICVPAGNPGCETPLVSSFAMPSPRVVGGGRSARLPGESRLEMRRRQLGTEDAREQSRSAAFGEQRHRQSDAVSRLGAASTVPAPEGFDVEETFDLFVGYWLLETIDDWNQATAIQFYRAEGSGAHRARFYDGTQSHLREVNDNDAAFNQNPVSFLGPDIEVAAVGPTSLRFHNTSPAGGHLSSDELTSTIRIQDADPDIAYAQFWTNWDGTGDDSGYGALENLTRYRRLAEPPEIQRNDQPSPTDWNNPVAILSYVRDYFAELGQVEKVEALEQRDWIGAAGFNALFDEIRTVGKTRVSTVSTTHRGGAYIGVWRTQFPLDFPLTTIHTAGFHHLTPASTVTISGFTGAYAVLNGIRKVAAYPPSSISQSTPEPWQRADTREHYVHVVFDSSGIVVAYDPNVHGVATLTATHGPVTPSTGYRNLMAAILDFTVSAFGPGTHTRLRMWTRYADDSVPETMSDLQSAIAKDEVYLNTIRLRTYQASPSQDFYWNASIVGGSFSFPNHNLNDPFGLGFGHGSFNIDIDLENYLDPDTLRNVFFTVTGPTLPAEPVTSLLTGWGYPSNGSRVVFQAAPFMTPPADLVDGYGTHAWVQYASADGFDDLFHAHYNLAGGIVRSELSCGRTVAYIRIGDTTAFDEPFFELATRSLVFGRDDFGSKVGSNWTAAMAALLTDLEGHDPQRYILDIRANGGGYGYVGDAFAALFGGNRFGPDAGVFLVSSGLEPSVSPIDGYEIQSCFDSVQSNHDEGETIDADEAAAVFPDAVVRGTAESPVEVVILTSSRAASGGDIFPHSFLGQNANSRVHNLGQFVTARIVGDIDGRLWSGIKGYDGTGLDPLAPDLQTSGGSPRTAVYMASDAGLLFEDRHGTLVNEQSWTQPATLLPGWYDTTTWQDLGLTPPAAAYPLGVCTRPLPTFANPASWRDTWLEYAIVTEE